MEQKDKLAEYVYRELMRGKTPDQIRDEFKKAGWWDTLSTYSYKYETNYAMRKGLEKYRKQYPDRAAKLEAGIAAAKYSQAIAALLLFLLIFYVLAAGGWQVVSRIVCALTTRGSC